MISQINFISTQINHFNYIYLFQTLQRKDWLPVSQGLGPLVLSVNAGVHVSDWESPIHQTGHFYNRSHRRQTLTFPASFAARAGHKTWDAPGRAWESASCSRTTASVKKNPNNRQQNWFQPSLLSEITVTADSWYHWEASVHYTGPFKSQEKI